MRPVDRPISFPSRDPQNDDVRQRLRDMPCQVQPPYTWAQFQLRSRMRHQSWRESSGPRVTREHAMAAACVTALVAALAIWGRADHGSSVETQAASSTRQSQLAQATQPSQPVPEAQASSQFAEPVDQPPSHTSIAQSANPAAAMAVQAAVAAQFALLTRAQTSERWLARQPAEPIVVRVGPRLAVANLEDRLAWMDDVLTEARYSPGNDANVRELQQQRARLVNSLAQVRYAETLAARTP